MNLEKDFIVIDDKPKTQQIDFIHKKDSYGYSIRFKDTPKVYNYSYHKVKWLSNPTWVDPTHSKVFVKGKHENQVKEIWKFESADQDYWRIICNSGFIIEDIDQNVTITTSCLDEKEAKDTFTYLKNVASINPLGKDENSDGILKDMYDKCDFIGNDTAASCYLNPTQHAPKSYRKKQLIFPFGL